MHLAVFPLAAKPGCGLLLVGCERFACVLSATACAARHVARWPSGRRKGKPRFLPCACCIRGAEVVARLERCGWNRPPDSQPPDVLDPTQRAARARWLRSFPIYSEPEAPEPDPLTEAGSATPDDRGEPADCG
jgi:hypothetical protein